MLELFIEQVLKRRPSALPRRPIHMRFNTIGVIPHFESRRVASMLPKASPNTIVPRDQRDMVFEYTRPASVETLPVETSQRRDRL